MSLWRYESLGIDPKCQFHDKVPLLCHGSFIIDHKNQSHGGVRDSSELTLKTNVQCHGVVARSSRTDCKPMFSATAVSWALSEVILKTNVVTPVSWNPSELILKTNV